MEFCLDVKGPLACFTRPEMKVERVSYDVITPSAARSIFEAILWKPAIKWRVTKIEVLNPIKWMNFRRNEVGNVVSVRNVTQAMKKGSGNLCIYADDSENRQQRASLLLKDVHYRLHATFEMTRHVGERDSYEKFVSMFERRAKNGQCVCQPYLGCREFACSTSLVESPSEQELVRPISESRDLGWMLYDIDYTNKNTPIFYRPELVNGVIEVPNLYK